jgi:hypothetical protein
MLFGGALLGLRLREALPGHHQAEDSRNIVLLGAGLVVTMSALVLGLVVNSAQAAFDGQRAESWRCTHRTEGSSRSRTCHSGRPSSNRGGDGTTDVKWGHGREPVPGHRGPSGCPIRAHREDASPTSPTVLGSRSSSRADPAARGHQGFQVHPGDARSACRSTRWTPAVRAAPPMGPRADRMVAHRFPMTPG